MFETTYQIQNVEVDMIQPVQVISTRTFGFDSTMKHKVICGATSRMGVSLDFQGPIEEKKTIDPPVRI